MEFNSRIDENGDFKTCHYLFTLSFALESLSLIFVN